MKKILFAAAFIAAILICIYTYLKANITMLPHSQNKITMSNARITYYTSSKPIITINSDTARIFAAWQQTECTNVRGIFISTSPAAFSCSNLSYDGKNIKAKNNVTVNISNSTVTADECSLDTDKSLITIPGSLLVKYDSSTLTASGGRIDLQKNLITLCNTEFNIKEP